MTFNEAFCGAFGALIAATTLYAAVWFVFGDPWWVHDLIGWSPDNAPDRFLSILVRVATVAIVGSVTFVGFQAGRDVAKP